MRAIIKWLKHVRFKRERRDLECYLFQHGPVPKWIEVRDENSRLGIWKGWPL